MQYMNCNLPKRLALFQVRLACELRGFHATGARMGFVLTTAKRNQKNVRPSNQCVRLESPDIAALPDGYRAIVEGVQVANGRVIVSSFKPFSQASAEQAHTAQALKVVHTRAQTE